MTANKQAIKAHNDPSYQKHRANRTDEALPKRRTARPVDRVPGVVRQPVDLSVLQRMETYDGVTVLATNLRANLDEAFTRRLHFAVDFPFPEEADRLRIWQALFPPGVPREPDLDFAFLARRFKLTGGNIRNIIVSAVYLAAADGQRVTMAHLLHGTRRELQKMGRLVGDEDLRVS